MADAATNWIDFFISLAPVAQTGIWAGVIVSGLLLFRRPVRSFAEELVRRLNQGDKLTTPWLSLERLQEREAEVVKQVTENLRRAIRSTDDKQHRTLSEVDEAKIETIIEEVGKSFIVLNFPSAIFRTRSKDDVQLSIYVTDWVTVSDFLNDAYLSASSSGVELPVWTYGIFWRLKNQRTGKFLEKTMSGSKTDNRPFSSLGLLPGDILNAERVR